MKKTIMAFLLVAGITLGVKAQDKKMKIDKKDVPQAVTESFNSTFANAKDVEWKKKGNDYKVSFEMNDTEHYAILNSSGTVISQGQEIPESQLPTEISNAIKKDHPNHRIDDVYTVAKDGTTSYKVTLDGSPDRKVMYSSVGTMIKDKVDED